MPFIYSTTTRQGYHEFKPLKGSCLNCPFALKKDKEYILRISIHQPVYDRVKEMRLSWRGYILRKVRSQAIELSFKKTTVSVTLDTVKTQVLMIVIIQNLKKWAKIRSLKQVGLRLTYKITAFFNGNFKNPFKNSTGFH